MTPPRRSWPVVVTTAADSDVADIIRWTADRFGAVQGSHYAEVLYAALEALAEGPTAAGVKARDDIRRGIYTLHVGRRGRHFLVFRLGRGPTGETVEVLRVLHDARDLARHLSGRRTDDA